MNEECVHYWVLGRSSTGVCKYCHETNTFIEAAIKYNGWFPNNAASKARTASMEIESYFMTAGLYHTGSSR